MGDDVLDGGLGDDTIDGGLGVDTVSYENSNGGVTVNLSTNIHSGGDAQGDSLISIENIIGSVYDDTLVGDENDNTIEGGEGNDIIEGGLGNDIIDGGLGVDTVSYENSNGGVTVNLSTNIHSGGDAQGDSLISIENVIGSVYDDTLTGDSDQECY